MKPILIVEQHPEIAALDREFNDRAKFLCKKAEDLRKEPEENRKEFWEKMHIFLKHNNFDKTPEKREMAVINGVLYLKEDKDQSDGIMNAIKGFFT